MEMQYSKLDSESTEIRLLDLAPGSFTDTIRFCLWHAFLQPPALPQRQRISLEELKMTLPRGWTAAETEQDRYRFIFEEDETENTSWTHPDPTIDRELWKPLEELPGEGYQPAYEALSYTWGKSEKPEVAFVEYSPSRSHQDRKRMEFSMQENLASALRHLRYPEKVRTLWIDAICINQKDDAEKTHQVKQMWLLYKLSQKVVVWLGSETANSNSALSTLKHLGSQLEVSRDNRRYRSPQATETEWFRAVCPLPYEEKTWRAINDLFYRTWFERLWIWQEIQLANSQATVVCGQAEIPWQTLRRAVICLMTKQNLPMPSLRRRLELIEPLTNERGSSSMNLLLNISRQRKCANPKDKIYGMLSICGPRLSKKIEPHYAEDWSTGDVYQDVFLKYLEQTNRLDLLSGCDSTLQQGTDPSWLPNWTVPRNTWPLYGYTFASGISASQWQYMGRGILQVTGVQAAVVQNVSEVVHVDSFFDVLRGWEPKDLCERSYITGESLLDAYCTTIRAGYLAERWPRVAAPSLCEWKEQYLATVSSSSLRGTATSELTRNADLYWCSKLVQGRRLMETKDGYIGLAPSGASRGDLVCFLLGCKTPFLLRTASSSDDPACQEFKVIGECYAHGLDDGVAILGPLPEHIRVQFDKSSSGYGAVHTYRNMQTGEVTDEDPRLQPLSETIWERLPHRERLPDDPTLFRNFRNRVSGEVIDFDPRLLLQALSTGKKIQPFNLC